MQGITTCICNRTRPFEFQGVPCTCRTRQERTAQPDDAVWTPVKPVKMPMNTEFANGHQVADDGEAWTPVEPVEVPMNPEFANGPQEADDDEVYNMALTPTASEFDAQTPAWEFDDLTQSPGRAETPPTATPMRQFEASLSIRDPAEAAAQVNFFQDVIQEEVNTDVQSPVPTPGTEMARLDAGLPTYAEQGFRMLNEDVI